MKKTMEFIEKALKRILMVILVIFTVIVVVQVIARYLLNSPLTWSEQVARYLFIWMIMLGTPLLFRMKAHIVFDLMFNKFPPTLQKVVGYINLLFITAFSFYYFVHSLNLCLRSGKTIAAGIEIPMNYVYASQPAGAGLLILMCIEMLVGSNKATNVGSAVGEEQ
jgi:TRAP-type transport system small permease protein